MPKIAANQEIAVQDQLEKKVIRPPHLNKISWA
jgi:hypothetical protein